MDKLPGVDALKQPGTHSRTYAGEREICADWPSLFLSLFSLSLSPSLPGRKANETKVVRNGSVAEAYQWSQEEARWIKVGEVVDAKAGGALPRIVACVLLELCFDPVDLSVAYTLLTSEQARAV